MVLELEHVKYLVGKLCGLYQIHIWKKKKMIQWSMQKHTDLGRLIGNKQCGNLRIFLPHIFYMKSILVILKPKKLLVWPFGQLWILIFGKISHLKMSKVPKNSKFRAAQMVNMAVFGASKLPKLNSCKIWVAEKSWNFHIVYSQLGCPSLYLVKKLGWN